MTADRGDRGYYRHPTIHGDRIAFVSEDDLWTVPADGGVARRLTTTPGAVAFPYYSPDGTRLACTAREEGHAEVYVMDADGGPPRRITWLGSGTVTQVVGWSPDGTEVLFSSDWKQRQPGFGHLFAVRADGGAPRALRNGPARAVSFQPGGPGVVIGRNSGDPARWKRYRGGTAGTLWIDRAGDGSYTQLVRLEGNVATPMWIGGRIFFLSDHEGIGNLYSCTPTGRDIRRHTSHGDYYVRFPSTDGQRIVYHAGADIFFFDVASGREQAVSIRLLSSRAQRSRKFVPAGRYLEGFDLHPKGHSIASVHRGRVYTMPLWEGAATRRDKNDGARHRLARWMPDGKRLVTTTDEAGEEALLILSANGEAAPRRIDGDFGRLVDLRVAPAGPDRVALTNQRQEVIVVDLASGRSKRIERSEYNRIEGLAWSPDGRWLAYGFADTRRTMGIHLWDASTGKVAAATRSDFRDYRPSFDPEGKYLYFLSDRVFDPVADSQYFDYGFPKGVLPMLLPLRKDLVSPFSPATREPRAPGAPNGPKKEAAAEGPQREGGEAKKQQPPVAVTIDLEGIEDRAVAFPVPEARYGRIAGVAGSRVLFSSYPVEGTLGQTWAEMGEPPAKGRLEAYDIEQAKTELVQERITDFHVSMEGKTIGVRAGNRVRVLPSSHKDQKLENEAPGRESGWLDIDRIRVSVVPQLEWRQMFREAWRLQRDQFWTPDMSGIDWKKVHDRYAPLVDRVASRAEFSDLMWEMQGELGTSHCYELGGDYRPEPAWHQGFLGADLELDPKSGAWRIARIPRGDTWDEKRRSPLAAPGLGIREGDEIVEVAGQRVGRDVSPYERLIHLAQQVVQLTRWMTVSYTHI
ncbi:MAG: PDZ domain-containing protein, partial [Candidatus Eisenbacteria bacterium]|nr:PDZ domain-containing protein [Candidatus Eisenbacteria bacterium]